MAEYTVAPGHVGAHAKTLTAATEDVITFTGADLAAVEVQTNGTADIYVFTGKGAGPATVAGGNCWRIPAVAGSRVVPVERPGDTVVRLVSSGTPTYSVQRA